MKKQIKVDKSKMKDDTGRLLTQSLFIEMINSDYAMYSLKEDDFEFEGKLYPSLRKCFLSCSDPTEYEFATTYLHGWKHWQRLQENRFLNKHFEEWRAELEYKLRSEAVTGIIKSARGGNIQAAKWLSDAEWKKRAPGRPSKDEVKRNAAIDARISSEYEADVLRLLKTGN